MGVGEHAAGGNRLQDAVATRSAVVAVDADLSAVPEFKPDIKRAYPSMLSLQVQTSDTQTLSLTVYGQLPGASDAGYAKIASFTGVVGPTQLKVENSPMQKYKVMVTALSSTAEADAVTIWAAYTE